MGDRSRRDTLQLLHLLSESLIPLAGSSSCLRNSRSSEVPDFSYNYLVSAVVAVSIRATIFFILLTKLPLILLEQSAVLKSTVDPTTELRCHLLMYIAALPLSPLSYLGAFFSFRGSIKIKGLLDLSFLFDFLLPGLFLFSLFRILTRRLSATCLVLSSHVRFFLRAWTLRPLRGLQNSRPMIRCHLIVLAIGN